MAENSRSSFIPKQTSGMVPSVVKRRRKFHAFNFIASVVMLASLAFAGGTYFYRGYAESALTAEKQALAAERQKFNETDILEVQIFERKLSAAEYLLDNHIFLSKIFEAFELETKEGIQFTGLELEQRPSQDVTITATGGTQEFKTLALQGFEFEGSPIFKDAVFTELSTADAAEADGTVSPSSNYRINFTLKGNAGADDLKFSESEYMRNDISTTEVNSLSTSSASEMTEPTTLQ